VDVSRRRRRGPLPLVAALLLLLGTVVLALNIDRVAPGDTPRLAAWAAVVIAASVAALLARGSIRRR
jgi:hypothetical protein